MKLARSFPKLIIGALFFGVIASGLYVWSATPDQQVLSDESHTFEEFSVIHFDSQLFYKSIQKHVFPMHQNIRAGIVPHHLLAGELIADFFQRVTHQNYQTVILLGPNHQNIGQSTVIYSGGKWNTPVGSVNPNMEMIDPLQKLSFVTEDNQIMQQEHSVSGIMPYVAHYMPKAQIIPLVISNSMTSSEFEQLLNWLKAVAADDNVLLVGAVDFSHYLNSQEAANKDKQTQKALENFSTEKILNYGNDHLDSPPVVALILESMKANGYNNLDIVNNTNSAEVMGFEPIEVTSYFEILVW